MLFVLFFNACKEGRNLELKSPNKQLAVGIDQQEDGELAYTFKLDNNVVLDSSRLGYRLANGLELPASGWKIEAVKQASFDGEWTPLWGKRQKVKDQYNQMIVLLKDEHKETGLNQLEIVFRLYNDGLAFQYRIPNIIVDEEVQKELTEFKFVTDPICWFYNGENANYGPVNLTAVETDRPSNVTLQCEDDLFLNIHEANLMTGDPLVFHSQKGENSLTVASSAGESGRLKDGYVSAWRVILAGKTPGALVDSHLIELLNPDPDPSMDFSWVKPGVAVWDWRIDGAEWGDFTYSMSYPSWIKMVDFSAEQGFKALVLDANWYGPEFESESDPIKGDKAKDVQRIIAYGKEKGVGVWLYLNDVGGRQYPIEETLKQYGDWGAAGVKYGFMRANAEEKNLRTQMITKLCAESKLLVDYHDGPVHPYGQMRTWPNAVTREFCHAQLDAHRVFDPSTFCTTVFVNMVAGPLDMNNGMFDLRQGNTTRVDENQPVPSTLVSEAARTLIVFSGVTILPDIPEYYQKYPELLDFISSQKMPWVESKTLDGKIGEYIVMMRQTDDAYLVAAATNEEGRTIELPLSFLGSGTYQVNIIEDGQDAHYLTNRESWNSTTQKVTSADQITLTLAPGGGSCLKFTAL